MKLQGSLIIHSKMDLQYILGKCLYSMRPMCTQPVFFSFLRECGFRASLALLPHVFCVLSNRQERKINRPAHRNAALKPTAAALFHSDNFWPRISTSGTITPSSRNNSWSTSCCLGLKRCRSPTRIFCIRCPEISWDPKLCASRCLMLW